MTVFLYIHEVLRQVRTLMSDAFLGVFAPKCPQQSVFSCPAALSVHLLSAPAPAAAATGCVKSAV